jgi:hypothetical protein
VAGFKLGSAPEPSARVLQTPDNFRGGSNSVLDGHLFGCTVRVQKLTVACLLTRSIIVFTGRRPLATGHWPLPDCNSLRSLPIYMAILRFY